MSQQSLDDYLSEMNQLRDSASSVKDDIAGAKNRILQAISGEVPLGSTALKVVGDTASGLGGLMLERGLEPYLKMGLGKAYNSLFKNAADKSKLAKQGEQEPARPTEDDVPQQSPETAPPEPAAGDTPEVPASEQAAPEADTAGDAAEAAPEVAEAAAPEVAAEAASEAGVDLSAAARSALRDEVVGKLRNMGENDLADSLENGEAVTDQAIDALKYKDIFDDEATELGERLDTAQKAFRAGRSSDATNASEPAADSAPEAAAEAPVESAVETAGEEAAEQSVSAVQRAANFVQAARSAGQTTDSTLARAIQGRQAQQQELSDSPEADPEAGLQDVQATQDIESAGRQAASNVAREVAAETGEEGATVGDIASGALESTVANATTGLSSAVEGSVASSLETAGAGIGEATGGETGGLGLLIGGLVAGVGALVEGLEKRKEKKEEEAKTAEEEQEISSAQQQIAQINQQTQQRIQSLSKPTMQVGI